MTETNTKPEIAWGSEIQVQLTNARQAHFAKVTAEANYLEAVSRLNQQIDDINKLRRARVLALLKSEGRAICLMHGTVFPESGFDTWLAKENEVVLVNMRLSWTDRFREYDSTTDLQHRSSNYETTVCTLCKQVVKVVFTDLTGKRHTLQNYIDPDETRRVKLYNPLVLDIISHECYNMPIVTERNLKSL